MQDLKKKCKCGLDMYNAHFGLCRRCNNMRLYGNEFGKQYKTRGINNKFKRTSKNSKKFAFTSKRKNKKSISAPRNSNKDISSMKTLDEIFYKKCFEISDHKCEECGELLPAIFKDERENIAAIYRYSHIIPKSIAPELRHNINNINILCLKCHSTWEFGDKSKMSIYSINIKNETVSRFLEYSIKNDSK